MLGVRGQLNAGGQSCVSSAAVCPCGSCTIQARLVPTGVVEDYDACPLWHKVKLSF